MCKYSVISTLMKKQAGAPEVKQVLRDRFSSPSFVEEVLTRVPGRVPNKKDEEELLSIIAEGSNGSLDGHMLNLGGFSPKDFYSRIWSNPRTGVLGKTIGLATQWPRLLGGNEDLQSAGPFYSPLSDLTVNPWKEQAATLHELGHAIDFNKGKVPNNWFLRQLKGLGRDAYTFAPGLTLWKEHAAWRKGQNAYLEGAAKRNLTAKKVKSVLEGIAHSKAPALGTYWGGTAGLLSSIYPLYKALEAGKQQSTVWPWLIAAGVLPAVGALSGMGIGTMLRNRSKEKMKNILQNEYPKLVEKYKLKNKEETKVASLLENLMSNKDGRPRTRRTKDS